MAVNVTWTEQQTELLIQYWREGFSASQIAKLLGGGRTRNSIIGRAHRLGLRRRLLTLSEHTTIKKQKAAEARERRRLERKLMVMTTPKPVRIVAPVERPGEPAPLYTMRTDMGAGCRWICADPRHDDTAVCGHAIHARKWCEHHYFRVYTGATVEDAERRRRKQEREAAFAAKLREARAA